MFDVNAAHTLARWQYQERQLQQQQLHREQNTGHQALTSTEREFEDLNLWAAEADRDARGQRRVFSWSRLLPASAPYGALHLVLAQLKQRATTAH